MQKKCDSRAEIEIYNGFCVDLCKNVGKSGEKVLFLKNFF